MKAQTKFIVLSLILLSSSMSAMALTINVFPLHIQNGAGDNVSVMARVTNNSTPLNNTLVNFITNLGYLSSASALTNASGFSRVFITTTESGNATITASIRNVSNTTNVVFSPLGPESINIAESENPVTAGNVTTVTIDMSDQFGNINDTAELTLNITLEDVFGNPVKETHIKRTPYTSTHIQANSTDLILTNNPTIADPHLILDINSTVAGNITIYASCEGIFSSKVIEVEPGTPSGMELWYNNEYTVNTTSEITAYVYDIYNNPVKNALVRFNATPPESTPYNSPTEYNSLNFSNLQYITGSDGIALTVFRTDKRAGGNTINITVANTYVGREIIITGFADAVNKLFLTYTPPFAYANNKDTYSLTGQALDKFLNPIIPIGPSIKEQVVFYSGNSSVIVPLNNKGKASVQVGPTPYIQNVSIVATYKNASGYTNITNSTMLQFIAGSNISLGIYVSPDTLLAKGLNGNHESAIKTVAMDEWGHTLPNVNLAISTTNATIGNLSMNDINATTIYATTNIIGNVNLKFLCSNIAGNTTIIATAGNATASNIITVKDVPFLSVVTNVSYQSPLKSGDVVNVTTVVSIEGDLPITRPAASAMLVLDRSGSMDPDYYAGTPLDVVLVLDRSGSMSGTPIADAKAAAEDFVDNLVSNSKVGIVSFSTTSGIDLGMTPLNAYINRNLIDTAIDSISAGGNTAMGEGMGDANDLLINSGRSGSKKVMIVLTDGNTNTGDDQEGEKVIDYANDNGITIYTIGLGNNLDEALLKHIASETGGKYYNAPDSSELRSVYNAIAQELSDYDISDVEYGVEGFTPYDYTFQDSLDIEHYVLKFKGYDLDTIFDAGSDYGGSSAGECLIRINRENFASVPSHDTASSNNKWIDYEYDITDYLNSGSNTITFYDYYAYEGLGDWTSRVKNVEVFRNGTRVAYYSADTDLSAGGYNCAVNNVVKGNSFVDTFQINETINDLKVRLEWEHNSSNLDLQLTSPSGIVYGSNDNTTGYFPDSDTSEYVWIQPLSYLYPDNDTDSVEEGTWTVRVTGSGSGTEPFNISTYIDKKSAIKLSSHVFMSSFDESRGDKAGLALYSFKGNVLTNNQTSFILKNSTWVGYFTVQTTGRYYFSLSWDDSSNIGAYLYDGTDLLDSTTGTGTCEVSSLLFAGQTYYLDITKEATSPNDTHFRVNVTSVPLDTTIMTAYYENGNAKPKLRTWDDSHWSLESSAGSVGAYPYFVSLESSRIRSEVMMVTEDSDKDANVQIWDGGSWGSVKELSSYLYSNSRKGFDVKYEQLSGDAVVAYMNTNINSRVPQYQVWDGSSWNSASAVNSTNTGAGSIGWVKLEANPKSDEMVLATLDSSNDIRAQVWNGNSWKWTAQITNNAATSSYQCFDIAYEQQKGRAMVVWADSGSVKYRIWNGTTWGNAIDLYSFSSNVYWLKLAADPHSNNMILVSQDTAYDIYANTWNGSSWSTRLPLETDTGTSSRRTVDVAFEQASGTGLVVWGDSSSIPKYKTWNGVSWSNEASASDLGSGTPRWVQLNSDPLSDEIFLMTSDTFYDPYDLDIQKWNGSSWSNVSKIETSSGSYEGFDIAYITNNKKLSAEDTSVLWSEWTGNVTSSLYNNSLSHLSNSIDTITADGLTAMDEGLFVANNELASVDGNSTIVLMTDGLDNAGYHSLLEEAYRAKENNTVIYTVGFGNYESEVDPMLLEIANITGGEYYFAPNSSVLKDIFKGIAEQITNFSAQGPVLNIYIPSNYSNKNTNTWANVTYKHGTSNCTTGNVSYFIKPKWPGRGNAEPIITNQSHNSILTWQLPNLSPGEKWGIWYQMVVEGSGSVPIIMPQSYITYVDLNSTIVYVTVDDVSSEYVTGGSSPRLKAYPPGSLTLTPYKSLLLINEPTKMTVYVKDTTGNTTIADIILYTNLGFFNDYGNNYIIIRDVSSGETLNFSSSTAGNAYITAYVYGNSSIKDEAALVIRPKGMIRIN